MATKLDKLLQQEAQLKAQIQQAKAVERTLEKKRDTRRKILVGAAVMARVESGRWPQADLLEMMDGFLSRPNERELFDLDVLDTVTAEASVKSKSVSQQKSAAAKGSAAAGGQKQRKSSKQKSSKLPESDLDIEKEFNL